MMHVRTAVIVSHHHHRSTLPSGNALPVATNVTEVVRGVGRIFDVVLGCGGREEGLDAGRSDGEVPLNHGGNDAGNVWGGHGGAGDGVDGVLGTDPGGGDG